MHHLLFILICGIWGSSFVLMKYGLPVFGPVGVGAWRVSASALTVAILWGLQRRRWPLAARDMPALIVISLMSAVIPFVVQPYIIRVIEASSDHGSSFAGMMVSLVPLMTIIASVFILRVHATPRQWLGVVGGLAAMGVLFGDELAKGVAVTDLLLASISPACYAVANTWIKRRFNETPPLVLLMCTMGIAAMVLVPASLVVPPGAAPDGDVTPLPVAVGAMLALGIVCTALAPFMFYKLVQSHGPLFAGMVTYVIPCVAMLLGWAQGETISPMQLAALGGILAMVALVQTAHPKPADAAAEGGACMALPEDGESGDTAYSLPDRPASSAESP